MCVGVVSSQVQAVYEVVMVLVLRIISSQKENTHVSEVYKQMLSLIHDEKYI